MTSSRCCSEWTARDRPHAGVLPPAAHRTGRAHGAERCGTRQLYAWPESALSMVRYGGTWTGVMCAKTTGRGPGADAPRATRSLVGSTTGCGCGSTARTRAARRSARRGRAAVGTGATRTRSRPRARRPEGGSRGRSRARHPALDRVRRPDDRDHMAATRRDRSRFSAQTVPDSEGQSPAHASHVGPDRDPRLVDRSCSDRFVALAAKSPDPAAQAPHRGAQLIGFLPVTAGCLLEREKASPSSASRAWTSAGHGSSLDESRASWSAAGLSARGTRAWR